MDKIEVNPMTALVEGHDMPPERGEVCGWGWTHWDGPEHGKLYIVYTLNQPYVTEERITVQQEIYVEGELVESAPLKFNIRKWVLERGWRPVIYYGAGESSAGPYGPDRAPSTPPPTG